MRLSIRLPPLPAAAITTAVARSADGLQAASCRVCPAGAQPLTIAPASGRTRGANGRKASLARTP